MKLISKLNDEKDDYENLQVLVNRAVKNIKETRTEQIQNETPILELFDKTIESLCLNDWISVSFLDRLFLEELMEQVTEHDWHPENMDEVKDYLELRKKLVLPIMEQGTMEYKILSNAYDNVDLEYIYRIMMTLCGVFFWKTIDYHELPTDL